MKAIGWTSAGSNEQPKILDVEAPEPGPGAVLVRVVSSAVNPADLKVSRGGFVGRLLHARVSPLVVGYDYSGVVERCGDGVTDLHAGDEVFGFLGYAGSTRQGAFAERLTAARAEVGSKPKEVSHEVLAAAATPGVTALQCLRDLGGLRAGGRVLIVGAAGGVGTLAVGIAKRLGAHVTAVCSTYAVDHVRSLGADEVIDRRKQDPMGLAGPYDVVFDAAAAHSYLACRHLLPRGGAYVTTLPSAGLFVGKLVAALSSHRCDFIAVKSVGADLDQLAGWIRDGMLVPIDARFPVRDVAAALDRLGKGEVRGRVVVQVEGGF